jgi:hypothetical protein
MKDDSKYAQLLNNEIDQVRKFAIEMKVTVPPQKMCS